MSNKSERLSREEQRDIELVAQGIALEALLAAIGQISPQARQAASKVIDEAAEAGETVAMQETGDNASARYEVLLKRIENFRAALNRVEG